MSHTDIDIYALQLANVIEQIYRDVLPGGECQRKAKVQVLLSDVLEHERIKQRECRDALEVMCERRNHWLTRYREIVGEAP